MMLKGGEAEKRSGHCKEKSINMFFMWILSPGHSSVKLCSVSRQTNLCPVSSKVLQCFLSNLDLISIVCHHEKLGIRSLLPHYPSQVSGLLTTSIHTL